MEIHNDIIIPDNSNSKKSKKKKDNNGVSKKEKAKLWSIFESQFDYLVFNKTFQVYFHRF